MSARDNSPLLRNSGWAAVAQTVVALWQWAALVLILQHFAAEVAAGYVLAMAIVSVVFAFTNGQLTALLVSDRLQERGVADYLLVRALSSVGAWLFCVAVGMSFASRSAELVAALGAARFLESVAEIGHALHQRSERMERTAISQSVRATCCLTALGLTIAAGGSVASCAAALVAAQAVALTIADLRLARISLREQTEAAAHSGFSLPAVRVIAGNALPLSIVVGLNTLSFNLPRYWLAAFGTPMALTIFALMSYLMTAGNMMYGAICQAALPRLARMVDRDWSGFVALGRKLVVVALALGVLGMLCALYPLPVVLSWMHSQDYMDYRVAILAMMAATSVLYLVSLSGCMLTAMVIVRSQSLITLVSVLVNVVGCAVFIPRYGLIGAPLALAAAFASKLLPQWLLLRREIRSRRSEIAALSGAPGVAG